MLGQTVFSLTRRVSPRGSMDCNNNHKCAYDDAVGQWSSFLGRLSFDEVAFAEERRYLRREDCKV